MIALEKRPTARTKHPWWEVDESHYIKWDKEKKLEDAQRKETLRLIKEQEYYIGFIHPNSYKIITSASFEMCLSVNVNSHRFFGVGYLLLALLWQQTEVMVWDEPNHRIFYFPIRLLRRVIEKNQERCTREPIIKTKEKWPRHPIWRRKVDGHPIQWMGRDDWRTRGAMSKHPMFLLPQEKNVQLHRIEEGEWRME